MSSVGSASQSSRSSFSTGTGGSSVASDSDGAALANLGDRDEDTSVQDMLEQNKGFWDAAFSCLLLLTKTRSVTSYRMLALRVVFEYLQIFRLVFNTRFLWVINTDLWIWKCIYWVLFRFLICNMGYNKYVQGLYAIGTMVLVMAVLTLAITLVLQKSDSSNAWLARLVYLVQNGVLVMFSICWVGIFDYLVFMFTCNWGHYNVHLHWRTVSCTAAPHFASMVFAGVTAVVFAVGVLCLAMAECSGNLVTDNLTATTVAETALKTTALKLVMIVVSTCLDEFPKPQAVLMFICPLLSTYFQLSSAPYLLPWVNHAWTGLWMSLVYTTSLLLVLNYKEISASLSFQAAGDVELMFRTRITWAVLWGILPAVMIGVLLSWTVYKWRLRPLKHFENARKMAAAGKLQVESTAVLKSIYRLSSPEQVEFLARCVRSFDPITELPTPEAISLCGLVIQAGLVRFPGDPSVLLVYANYVIHIKKEPRAARQQLQLAGKGEPGMIDRYNIFRGMDVLKRSRGDGNTGLDLMTYIDQQRNIRACMKAHKIALMTQRAFWHSAMRDNIKQSELLQALKQMQQAEQTAIDVYKRVLERYPHNGKLLKIWGRFQEWVLHDPGRAAKSYAEAVRRGIGENLLNLTTDEADSSGAGTDAKKIDEKNDGIVIIDAGGVMLLVNKVAYKMFGYERGELEGKNVSILMPQPFSGRHNSYLQNFLTTGVPKMLDTVRQVVALRKDHSMFPTGLWVRRLSGTGQESVFMGVLRPVDEGDPNFVRVWTTPTGLILCSDHRFGDWFGVSAEDLVGRAFSSLAKAPEAVERLIYDTASSAKSRAVESAPSITTTMLHKYLPAIDVEISAGFGGSDDEFFLVLNIRCLTDALRFMVVDNHGKIQCATSTLATMVGAKVGALTKMNVQQLVPPPSAQLHKGWMKELMLGTHRPWAGSCRGGGVVQLLAANGSKIPVRLNITTVDDRSGDRLTHRHIVKVTKATQEALLDDQRLRLIVNQRGIITSVPGATPKSLFGLNPAADLLGRPLAAFISQFEEFRVKQACGQLNSRLTTTAGNSGPGLSQVAMKLKEDMPKGSTDLNLLLKTEPDVAASDDSMLLTILAQAAQEGSNASYRVGVRSVTLTDDQIGKSHAEDADHGPVTATTGAVPAASARQSTVLLAALGVNQSSKLRPAVMAVEVVQHDWSEDSCGLASSLAGGVQFEVQLWRSDMLTGVLEVDQQLKVVRADPAMGYIMGCAGSMLHKKLLNRLVKLPGYYSSASELLESAEAQKAVSALKRSNGKDEAKVGRQLEGLCLHADGNEAKLKLQAVAKDSLNLNRVLMRVKLALPPSTGSLKAFLKLAGACGSCSPGGVGKSLLAAAADRKSGKFLPAGAAGARSQRGPKTGAGLRSSFDSVEDAGEQDGGDDSAEPITAAARHARGEAPVGGRSRRGSVQGRGVEEAEGETGSSADGGGKLYGAGAASGRQARRRSDEQWPRLQDGGETYQDGHEAGDSRGAGRYADGSVQLRQQSGAWKLKPNAPDNNGYDDGSSECDGRSHRASTEGGYAGDATDAVSDVYEASLAGTQLPKAELEALQGGLGSGSEADSEEVKGLDAASVSQVCDETAEISCDWRRAKRLKRILGQLDCPIARAPLLRFWKGTWVALGILLTAHIACFAILSSQVTSRQTDVYGVQQMTYAVDKSQMILLRANMVSKCGKTEFQSMPVCSDQQRAFYLKKHFQNTEQQNYYHHGLFLGFTEKVKPMSDMRLLHWWLLPEHEEASFLDSEQPLSMRSNASLWNLGNRYISAAREMGYAATNGLAGEALEADRHWQYIATNGKDSVFNAYAVSLDMYVRFCYSRLGDLGATMTALLVAELVVVALGVMAWQMDLIRRVAGQRMACFSVFLSLPTAMLRAMATAPCQVDDEDAASEADADDMDLQAAAAQTADAAGTASAKVPKSVRMSVTGGADGMKLSVVGGKDAKKRGDSSSSKSNKRLLSWLGGRYKIARHAVRGIMNRTLRVNGKKLQPCRGAFARFMLPLLVWWVLALVLYGMSFQSLQKLQAPLTSLQAAAHVQFLIGRVRVLANFLGFMPATQDDEARATWRDMLQSELDDLKHEYFVLLYGGAVATKLNEPKMVAPASVFQDAAVSDLFFKSTKCLRTDKSTCLDTTSQWYSVTHAGLDTMMQRFFADMQEFVQLPAAQQTVNASSYEFTWRVAANDMYDGLLTAGDKFVATTLNALNQLQQLHTYLLACTLVIMAGLLLVLLVPFKRQLVQESVRLAGLLSQLPQEADVEGQVKLLVLDTATTKKHAEETSKRWSIAKGVGAAAAAAARAAAAKAAGAMGNLRNRVGSVGETGAGGYENMEEAGRYAGDEHSEESSNSEWE